MFASRRDAADAPDAVRERFVRVVGLPEIEDFTPSSPVSADPPPTGPPPTPAAGLRGVLGALDPGRPGVRALAIVAVIAVALAGFFAWRARPRVEQVSTRAEPTAAAASAASGPAGLVVVAVAGRVQHPGLVRLPAGARVADAIEAAGGVLPDTDLSSVNLARKLADGELVAIGVTPPPGAATGADSGRAAGAGPLNINTATEAQLDALPGIGPVLAQHIVAYRTQHGQFRSVDELRQVDGLGAAKFAQIKPLVTV